MENKYSKSLQNAVNYMERKEPVRGSNYEYSGATLRRRGHALIFRSSVERVKNKNSTEIKACISSNGCRRRWREDLYGIPRIAVHGIDSICVALREEDVVSLRHQVYQEDDPFKTDERYWIQYFHCKLRNAVIYEVEELAVPCMDTRKKLNSFVEQPFGVVSVIPSINGSHQAGLDNAIKFLQEEMNSDASFTFSKTVKTTIGALQQLFGKKFKANEIEIFVLRSDDGSVPFESLAKALPTSSVVKKMQMQNEGEAEKIPIHAERSIKDYLTLINKPT